MKRDVMTFTTWFTGSPETKDVQAHITCDQIPDVVATGPTMGHAFAAMIDILAEDQFQKVHGYEA